MESTESAAVRYRFKVDHARQVERVLQWLGWTVVVLATMSLLGLVGLWMTGRLSGGQALGASLGTILGSILSGATAYGSGVNVGLGAERLELAAALARGPAGDAPDRPERRTAESGASPPRRWP
jgi:hypothetical protein